jgi:hypothetical protein
MKPHADSHTVDIATRDANESASTQSADSHAEGGAFTWLVARQSIHSAIHTITTHLATHATHSRKSRTQHIVQSATHMTDHPRI